MRAFPSPKSDDSRIASPISLATLIINKLPVVLSPYEISNRKMLIKKLIDTLHLSHPSRLEAKDSGYFSQKYNASMTDSEALLSLIHISEPTRPY